MRKKSKFKNVIFWTGTFILMVGFALTSMPGTVGAQEPKEELKEEPKEEFMLEDTVVTATRRAESLSDVPLSVTAFGKGEMEVKGLKKIDDLVAYTPGLVFSRSDHGANAISIRGISSGSGAGTTGIYIDDTPVQVRNLGYQNASSFPALFDLERVEVLRGPQGTLFGAGSEGGTVRFIQTAPNLDEPSAYARAELSFMNGGDPSYELGVAYGAPIIEGKLGFRASVFYREDGGYIDGIKGTPVILDPTGDAGPDSLTFTDVEVTRPDMNSWSTTGARVALKFALTDTLEITPSVTYQKIDVDDGYYNILMGASSKGDYRRLVWDAGDPATNPALTAIPYGNEEEGKDEFSLPAVAINWYLGAFEIISNTSYFDRDYDQYFDFTGYYNWLYNLPDPTNGFLPRPGDKAVSLYHTHQENFVQEIRIQSTDDSARLKWVAGLFYSRSKQDNSQSISGNMLGNASPLGPFYLPPFLLAVDDGPPFGPGSTAFENYFGVPLDENSTLWSVDRRTTDEQLAAFGQIDYDITEDLTLIVGLRVSRNELDFFAQYGGTENNQNQPNGMPGPVDPPLYLTDRQTNEETAYTPKIGLSYDINEDNMIYATVAKGFRPAGASQDLPPLCDYDLIDLGYVDENDNPDQPTRFGSDSVWSYEIGTKNSIFNGRLSIDGSAYIIDWKDIQSGVFCQTCAEGFTTNLGEARSKGFDLAIQIYPTNSLMLTGTVGYNKSEFTKDATSPGGTLIISDGSIVFGSPPPWVYSLSAHQNFSLDNGQPMYFHVDLIGRSEARRVGATDPNSPSYNPDLSPTEAYYVINARMGTVWKDVDISLFVNNVANKQPPIGATNNSIFLGLSPLAWTTTTLHPRTLGITMSYRY